MTSRAIGIGLLLGLGISAFGYLNDWVLGQSYVAGDLIPVSVYGLLVVALLAVNPLAKLAHSQPFSGSEYTVIVSLMLVASIIPGPGLMWTFSQTLALPHHYQNMYPGWKALDLVGYAPSTILVDPAGNEETVVLGLVRGLRSGSDEWLAWADIPWSAWAGTLSFWLPLIALSFVAGMCVIFIAHQHWSHREHLPYPVAVFASHLLNGAEKGWPKIFHDRRFLAGFMTVFGILLINGYYEWNPNSIAFPLTVDLTPLARLWPGLGAILHPTFFFAAIGFGYLISSDVSFSIGISAIAHSLVVILLTTFGVDSARDYLMGGLWDWQLFGAYLGLAIVVFYVGRYFYGRILLNAVGLRTRKRAEPGLIWTCRAALAAAAGMVMMLVMVARLHWLLALAAVALTGLLFLGVARISAETGLFFVQPYWHAVGVLVGVFGFDALGPNMLVTLLVFSAVLTIDPRTCLMPMAANALKLGEMQGVQTSRLARWLLICVLLALFVGVFATLYIQYNYGATQHDWLSAGARMPFNALLREFWRFEGKAGGWTGFDLSLVQMDPRFLWGAGGGLTLVLACSAARLRYPWWPIHPILFLIWGTMPGTVLSWSFLMGWIVKTAITKYGGAANYRRMTPLFIGFIAGEFAAGIFWALLNLIRYLCGLTTQPFIVHI